MTIKLTLLVETKTGTLHQKVASFPCLHNTISASAEQHTAVHALRRHQRSDGIRVAGILSAHAACQVRHCVEANLQNHIVVEVVRIEL